MLDTFATINTRIDAIKASERITKVELGLVSRDILTYIQVEGSNDIDTVNRLLAVLTPMNLATARLFFAAFLPFKLEDTGNFTTKIKGEKKLDKLYAASVDFLADEGNDIWTWAADNVKVEQKPKDYADKIKALVARALADENEGIDTVDVMHAVMAAGISINDIIVMIDAKAEADAALNEFGPVAPEVADA